MQPEQENIRMYPERPGTHIDSAIAILQRPPEFLPTEEEKREALTIEAALTVGVDLYSTLINDESPDRPKVRGVEKIYLDDKVNTLNFFVDYFTSSRQGLHALILLGFEPKGDEVHEAEVIEFLSGFDYSSIDAKEIADVSDKSQKFVEQTIADQMEKNNFESLDGLTVPTKITVVKNPEKLSARIIELRELKDFLKKYSLTESVVNSPQVSAVVNMHRRRVNDLIVSSYSDVLALIKQYKASPNKKTEDAIQQIRTANATPFFSDDLGGYALSRIDKYMNGAGEEIEDGNYSPISGTAEALGDEIVRSKGEEKKVTGGKYEKYKDLYKKVRVDSKELQEWIKKVINEYGILSAMPDDEYSPDRAGAAPDEKWQVVVDSKSANLAVNGAQKAVKIPTGFNRLIAEISPAGAVPGINHEVGGHVVQWENKYKMGFSLTKIVETDRSDVYKEGGGVEIETDTQHELFGQERGANTDYLAASYAKLNGLNYLDCVMAFFESNMATDPGKDKKKTAVLAANRVLRIFKNDSNLSESSEYLTNSQPLVYLEQDLVVKKLKEKGMEKLLHFGINLDVLADLHRVGMADIKNIWIPERKPSEILENEIIKKFENARNNPN